MAVSKSPANQGRKTHEDLASSKAKSAKSQFRDTKPESRPGAAPHKYGVSQAESIIRRLVK